MSGPVMDFPAAWEYVRTTDPTDHHDQCSWRSTGGALLCDCTVLNDEYKRREARNEQGRRTRMNRQQELDIIAGVLRRLPDPGAEPVAAAEHIIDALNSAITDVETLAREVVDSIPGTRDENDPMVQRHARALVALARAVEAPTDER